MFLRLRTKKDKTSATLVSGRKASTISKAVNPFNDILSLHSTLGNQVVRRLIQSGALPNKLTVGKRKDIFKQKAGWPADNITRMPDREMSGMAEMKEGVRRRFSVFSGGKEPLSDRTEKRKGAVQLSHEPGSQPKLQRTIGDGHDLQSERFAGDPVLEACYDNERLVRTGSHGDAVEKIQKFLIDSGFSLPRYGVDGAFGSETRAAVMDFQDVAGLDVDGIVGQNTIGRMDSLPTCPAGNVANTSATFTTDPAGAKQSTLCQVPERRGIPVIDWTNDHILIYLTNKQKPDCAGTADPISVKLFSDCGSPIKPFCIPKTQFRILFFVDAVNAPYPGPHKDRSARVRLEFIRSGKQNQVFDQTDDRPFYIKVGAPLNTKFGKKFNIGASEDLTLKILLQLIDRLGTATYNDSIEIKEAAGCA